MKLGKLTLILSVASLLGAASTALADDETSSLNQPDDGLNVTRPASEPVLSWDARTQAYGYRVEQGYGYVPQRDLRYGVIPPETVPLGVIPPTEFESTTD
jgi:hypothetical protein